MKDFLQKFVKYNALGGWIFAIVSVILLVASFVLPPTGVIDSSVLAGVGEMFAFAALFEIPSMISSVKDGKSLSMKKGNMEVNVSSKEETK